MRKKKIIAIVLAAALVAAGLGSFAYAQADDGHLVAFDQPFRCAYIEPDVDSVAADTLLSGHYSWNFHLHNNSEQQVDSPTISVETSHPEWFPDVTFPASWYRDKLDPEEKWYQVSALSTTEPITFTLGYDCSRTVEPLAIPAGGGQQMVTIKVKPVDERYTTNPYMRIFVFGTVGDHTEPEGAVPTINPEGITWDFRDWELGGEYTFTAELQVENPLEVDLLHKPHVNMFVESAEFLSGETGTTTTIYDEILDGDITYSVATAGDWQWTRIIADCWLVEYKPLFQPLFEHEPMTGQKLVGQGVCMEWTWPGEPYVNHADTAFFLTNPDCVSEITIENICVFAYDGTVVYEGLLRVKVDDEWEVYTGPLKPHQTLQTSLSYYDLPELEYEVEMWYTVEVFWNGAKEGLPLTGWAASWNVVREAGNGEAIDIIMWGTTQMVNMEQVLEAPKKVYNIGVTQILTHPDLDATRQGFIDQMAKKGFIEGVNVNYDFRNAEGDLPEAERIAQEFVSEEVDLILSITTPSSQACVAAAEGTGIPVVFAAVTEPVAAGIVSTWDAPRPDNVTGVSDFPDIKAQMELIKEILPEATVLGVIYNPDEANSVLQIGQLEAIKAEVGIEDIVEAEVATPEDVYDAAELLVDSGCDAIWIPTDNTANLGLEDIIAVAEDEENKIPLFGPTVETVERGCIATEGVDYTWEGEEAGRYAARILKGKFAGDIPVVKCSGEALVLAVNPAAAERMGVEIPQSVLDREPRIVGE